MAVLLGAGEDSAAVEKASQEQQKMKLQVAHLKAVMKELTGQDLDSVSKISEEARPSDPVAGLLKSQINFYFHIAFFVGCCLVKRSSAMTCFQREAG